MTASKSTRESGQEGSDESAESTSPPTHLKDGEIGVEGVMTKAQVPPEGGRLRVGTVNELVDATMNTDNIQQRLWMTPEQARDAAAQLLQCAEVAEQFDPEELE